MHKKQLPLLYFNPRPPCGGRQNKGMSSHFFFRFQSTSPVWRTTRQLLLTPTETKYFNPRPPCGGRHVLQVSGSDAIRFQSTSPVWRTTDEILYGGHSYTISIHVPRVEDDSNTALIVCSITLHKQAVLPIFSLSPHFLIGYITSPLLFFLRECTGIFMCASRSRSQIISGSVTSNDGFIPICFILFSYAFPRLYIRRLSCSLSISDSSFASTSLSFAASSWHSNTEFCTR